MRFNAFYSEDLPAWLPGCLLLPSYPSFLPATIALTPSPPPPLLLAAHPLPFTLLPVNLASCLHFKLMDLPRKDKEGEPRERRQIYICTYIGKRKKKKKETWKTSETFVSFMPNLYSRPKQRFPIFFPRESIPVGPRSRIIAPAGKILDEILVARTWWMSTFEIYAPTDTKKARAGLQESTAWIQTGMGEGPTENSSSDF